MTTSREQPTSPTDRDERADLDSTRESREDAIKEEEKASSKAKATESPDPGE